MNWSSLLRQEVSVWRPIPVSGVRQMEEEHGRVVEFLAAMREVMADGEGCIRMLRLLEDVTNYSESHFRNEEELMQQYEYPDAREHIGEHQRILTELRRLATAHQEGEAVFPSDLANLLHEWIVTHVAECDMKLAEFLMSKGVM